jgi:hypothetical protein
MFKSLWFYSRRPLILKMKHVGCVKKTRKPSSAGTTNLWLAKNFLGKQYLLLSQSSFIYFCRPVSVIWKIYVYKHISDSVQTVYGLPLLPNNNASEIFLHKSGALRSVDWIFIIGAPAWWWLGEYVTLDKTFYSLLLKQKILAAQLRKNFLPYCIPHGGFY